MAAQMNDWLRSRKGKVTLVAAAALIIVILIFWLGLSGLKQVTLKNRLEAQWQSLDVTSRSIDGHEKPQDWLASVFIGSSPLKTIARQIEGYKLEYIPTNQWLSGTIITVKSVSIEPELGYALAKVLMVARKDDIELQMRLTGSISYRGAEPIPNGKPGDMSAKFRIEPLELEPTARLGRVQFGLDELWTKLAPDIVTALAQPEAFEFSVPINNKFKFDIGVDIKGAKEVVNKNTGATITYDATLPTSTLAQTLSFSSPVFLPEGIWIMARQSDGDQNIVRPATPPAQSELASAVKALAEEVRHKTSEFTADPKTLSIWFSPTLLTMVASKLSELSDAARTFTIQTTAREGRLAEAKWRDDLLGDGGAYAELVDGNSGTVTLQLGKPTVTWESESLRMALPLDATMKANIHFHFDPVIGGGMGTSAGIEGKGSGTVNVVTQTKIIEGPDGLKVAAMNSRLSCDALKASATTDGVLKIDMGWISVPKVGAKVVMPLGRSQIGMVSLFDNRPLFLVSSADDPRVEIDLVKRDERIKKNPWAKIPPTAGLAVRLIPESITADASGMHTSVSMELTSLEFGNTQEEIDRARVAVLEQAKVVAERVAILLKQQTPVEECKGDAEVAIILGPIELGPQNDIVKFAKNAWNDMTHGGGPNNDLRKAVEAAAQAIDNALPDISIGRDHGGLGVQIGSWKF
jgi:hypothetical protein